MTEFSELSLAYGEIEQLAQVCHGAVWDGQLISKYNRTKLKDKGLLFQRDGYNYPTAEGVRFYDKLKRLFCKDRQHVFTPAEETFVLRDTLIRVLNTAISNEAKVLYVRIFASQLAADQTFVEEPRGLYYLVHHTRRSNGCLYGRAFAGRPAANVLSELLEKKLIRGNLEANTYSISPSFEYAECNNFPYKDQLPDEIRYSDGLTLDLREFKKETE